MIPLKPFILFTFIICSLVGNAQTPVWIETDSAGAIASRTLSDFPYTVDDFYAIAKLSYPDMTRKQYDDYVAKKYIETLNIDGITRVHRKAIRNLGLLNPEMNGGWTHRGWDAGENDFAFADSVVRVYNNLQPYGAAHRVTYKFTIDVPTHDAIKGDTLRLWMPLPIESNRQGNIEILAASHPYTLSKGLSVHNTIFFEIPVNRASESTHVEYTATFDTRGEYFDLAKVRENLTPYDKSSKLYQQYTSFEAPHIIRLDELAAQIAGGETDPIALSEKVYDYIITNFPWAGAREYSTIECMPRYVLEQGHGDCGQVALLYISLMRTLGIPARWESGWVLHPGSVGMHDWAEVYFPGTGWVPVDPSFGRFTASTNPDIVNFYSHATDAYRFASNLGVCGDLYPAKKYVRSETVDFQLGEVETSKGNLFYPGWDSELEIISITPITLADRYIAEVRKEFAPDKRQVVFEVEFDETSCTLSGVTSETSARNAIVERLTVAGVKFVDNLKVYPYDNWGIICIPVASLRTRPAHAGEMATQAVMGTPVRILDDSGDWYRIQTPDGYIAWVPDSSVKKKSVEEFNRWRTNPNRYIVSDLWQTRAYTEPKTVEPRKVVTDLVLGAIIEADPSQIKNKRIAITLPDGRTGWADIKSLTPVAEWADQKFDAQKILTTAYSLEGTPYLWGGMSTKSVDCSGLVKVSYLNNGIILRRDASQQALIGKYMSGESWDEYQAGDLLFFGNSTTGRVTHVGIYDSDARYVHSSGRVKRNSLDPESPDYLYSPLSAARMHGYEGTEGIVRVIEHPWYFNQSK